MKSVNNYVHNVKKKYWDRTHFTFNKIIVFTSQS